MGDWFAPIIAIGSLGCSAAAILTFWMRFSDRISKADAAAAAAAVAAAAAGLIAQEAKKDAHEVAQNLAIQSSGFALYREQVAQKYIDRDIMREVEDRVTQAIDRLGARLDRILERTSG